MTGRQDGAGRPPGVAAYNAGQGAAKGWIKAAADRDGFALIEIPYPQIRMFVEQVEDYSELYSRIYHGAFGKTGGST